MGALKAALTAIFNANNYTSSTSGIASKKIPVNESNGLPSGQIGMSDLASVLGGVYINQQFTGDADTIDIKGVSLHLAQGSGSNLPYSYCVILNIQSMNGRQTQFGFSSDGHMYFRQKWGTWKNSWTLIV